MAYPPVPDLQAFTPCMTPNLTTLGWYDQQLTAIEDYLNALGQYVDELTGISGLEEIQAAIAELQSELETLKNRVTVTENDIESINTSILDIENHLDSIDVDIDVLKVQGANHAYIISTLTSRLDTAESNIEGNTTNITSLETRVLYLEENPYVLPEASPTVLGGMYTVTDDDFVTYMEI